jgi:hypothetical protein
MSLRTTQYIAVALIWSLTIGLPVSSFATCTTPPIEMSATLQQGNYANCGDTSWELQAKYGIYLWDEGPYDGTGTCTGGYIKCDCTNVPGSYLASSKQFHAELVTTDPQEEYEWWWSIKNYNIPTLNACTSGACEADGYASETDSYYYDSYAGWDDEYLICNQ